MRFQVFWLSVIALALAAIAAGYFSGASSARLPPRPTPAPRVSTHVRAVTRDPSDTVVEDSFSNDDVVIERPPLADRSRWNQPRLSIVVGLCGFDAQSDARFVQQPEPVALDVDPAAPQAARAANLAYEAHDLVLVHVGSAPSQAQLARLRARLVHVDGLASRTAAGFPALMSGTGLLFFDERGNADATPFHDSGVAFAARDVTVDDRTAPSYIRFMLARTVQRSQREGRLVVLMRPRVHSLNALAALDATRTVQFVPLTQQ